MITLASASLARAQTWADAVWLRLDTGMHVGRITDIAVDPTASLVATAGEDKSIRVWSLRNGALISDIRPFAGEGEIGRIDSVAFHPNGEILLAGGPAFNSPADLRLGMLYLFFLDERPMTGLPNLAHTIVNLDISADQQFFAGAMSAGGLGMWSLQGQRVGYVPVDGLPFITPGTANPQVVDVQFDHVGRLVVATNDGALAVGTVEADGVFTVAASRHLDDAGRPLSIAASADARLVAVGYADRPFVDILTLPELTPVARLSVGGANPAAGTEGGGASPNLGIVSWGMGPTRDGLFAAGTAADDQDRRLLAYWASPIQGTTPVTLPIATDSVTALAAVPDGSVVFAASDPTWGRAQLANGALSLVYAAGPERMSFRSFRNGGLGVADGGRSVTILAEPISLAGATAPMRFQFDLDALRLTRQAAEGEYGTDPGGDGPGGLAATIVDSRLSLGGRTVPLASGERALALDTVGTQGLWLGTDYALSWRWPNGDVQASAFTPGAVWSVRAADADTAVAALGDGTVRWYRRDGDRLVERLALFIHADARRWVAWLPDGTFTHGEAGIDGLVGFQVNGRSGDLNSTWIDLSQLYDQYFQPERVRTALDGQQPTPTAGALEALALPAVDWLGYCNAKRPDGIVEGVLDGDSATRALARLSVETVEDPPADGTGGTAIPAGSGVCTSLVENTRGLARVGAAEVVAGRQDLPADGAGPEWLELIFSVEDGGSGVSHIDVFVNGRNVGRTGDTRALGRTSGPTVVDTQPATPAAPDEDREAAVVRRVVRLDPGRNEIVARAYGGRGGYARSEALLVDGPPPPPEPDPSELRVLAVGIDDYQGEIPDLSFAVADASAVAAMIRTVAQGLYDDVIVDVVDPSASDSASILDRLRQLAEVTGPEDALVLYLAGHGITDQDGTYYYVTRDALSQSDIFNGRSIDQDTLIAALGDIQARNAFVFLDTCYSGSFDLTIGGRVAAASGRFVLAASTKQEEALDSFDGVNGVFARAVLDGLEGNAPSSGTTIDALFLGAYVRERVPQLASIVNFTQTAEFRAASGGSLQPFPLATAR